jgi:hypothetical protein
MRRRGFIAGLGTAAIRALSVSTNCIVRNPSRQRVFFWRNTTVGVSIVASGGDHGHLHSARRRKDRCAPAASGHAAGAALGGLLAALARYRRIAVISALIYGGVSRIMRRDQPSGRGAPDRVVATRQTWPHIAGMKRHAFSRSFMRLVLASGAWKTSPCWMSIDMQSRLEIP